MYSLFVSHLFETVAAHTAISISYLLFISKRQKCDFLNPFFQRQSQNLS